MNIPGQREVLFDGSPLTVGDIEDIAFGRADVVLSQDDTFKESIRQGVRFLEKLLKEDGVIYGVTTGYGDSCGVSVPPDQVHSLPRHLYTFHGCGMGEPLSPEESRATLASRLASLCQGYSGVRYRLLEHLARLLQLNIVPVIPSEGSVGASGDLTPLSYIAAVLEGRREVWFKGQRQPTADVYETLGLQPLTLQPKEGLALMNGTAVMTGIACLAVSRAAYAARLAARVTSQCSQALQGNQFQYDPVQFSIKPHPGQAEAAAWIHSDLNGDEMPRNSSRLQDRYSLRCAPHVIGVLNDALGFFRQLVETELNSANDNPIIDGESEHVMHGGHFYGGHVAFAMDSLKTAVANVADLTDRQLAQLMDPKMNHGLPANLSGAPESRQALNHGFKAVQIACSAWTAEALKGTMPASVFSRSTECHNQDKVSMGTIAARDCQRLLTLTEQVLAAGMLAGWQGVQIRLRNGDLKTDDLHQGVRECLDHTGRFFSFVEEDVELESSLAEAMAHISDKQWALYD